jgi:hypothetical protein
MLCIHGTVKAFNSPTFNARIPVPPEDPTSGELQPSELPHFLFE